MQQRLSLPGISTLVWEFLKHDVPGRARHPFVFWLNLIELALSTVIFLWILLTKNVNGGVYCLLGAQMFLFAASACNHYLAPRRHISVLDQTAISVYILAVPLPFVWHNQLVVAVLLCAMLAITGYKYLEQELWRSDNLLFLTTGLLSLYACSFHAETVSGTIVSSMFLFALSCFTLKLWCNWYCPKPIPGYFEKSELGHLCFLLPAIVSMNLLQLSEQIPLYP